MDNLIERINSLYSQAMESKDVARKGNVLNVFLTAAGLYKAAATEIDNLLKTNHLDSEEIIEKSTLKEYYLYESKDCLYAFEYKSDNFDTAILMAREALDHISKAIAIINDSFDQITKEGLKEKLSGLLVNWVFSQKSIYVKLEQPRAKKAMISSNFIDALDSYTRMSAYQDDIYLYISTTNLEPVFKRIEIGNYYAGKANIAMSCAGVYKEQAIRTREDYTIDFLKQFISALEYITKAHNNNPENIPYKTGIDTVKENIISILENKKNMWSYFLTELENPKTLKKIMKQIDIENYKKHNTKLEIENNPLKKIFLTSGLMSAIFIMISLVFFYLATSEMSWYALSLYCIFTPVIFTLIGAFSLKTTDSLKEENFMKLVKLALMINIQGLKILNSPEEEKEVN